MSTKMRNVRRHPAIAARRHLRDVRRIFVPAREERVDVREPHPGDQALPAHVPVFLLQRGEQSHLLVVLRREVGVTAFRRDDDPLVAMKRDHRFAESGAGAEDADRSASIAGPPLESEQIVFDQKRNAERDRVEVVDEGDVPDAERWLGSLADSIRHFRFVTSAATRRPDRRRQSTPHRPLRGRFAGTRGGDLRTSDSARCRSAFRQRRLRAPRYSAEESSYRRCRRRSLGSSF